jgi:acetyltransferase-like isoleucine patch superfamily enzyme
VYPGVTIGEGCVIGHATTITHDVPPGSKVYNIKQIERNFRT